MGNEATTELGGSKSPKNASVKVIAAGKRQEGGSLIRESSSNSRKYRVHDNWDTQFIHGQGQRHNHEGTKIVCTVSIPVCPIHFL